MAEAPERESQSLTGIDPKDVGPIKPASDKFDPDSQKYCADFADGDWKTFYDFLPDKDEPCLYAMDKRAPLTYKVMKEFLASPDLDIPGLKRTDRLCSAFVSCAEMAVCFLAYSLRCTFAPLNQLIKPEEFEFEFDDLPAVGVIVMHKDHWDMKDDDDVKGCGNAVQAARRKKLPIILEITPDADTVGLFKIGKHPVCRGLKGDKLTNPLESVTRNDIAIVLHTSGTTKKPKIVPITHESIAVGAKCHAAADLMDETDVFVNYMPMFHIAGLLENFLTSLCSGSGTKFVAIRGIYQAHVFYNALAAEPYPTAYSAVPVHNLTLIQHAAEMSKATGEPWKNHIKIIRNDSAALVPSLAVQMEETIDAIVMPAYSMTESNPITSNPRYGTRKLKSVGPTVGPSMKLFEAWPSNVEIKTGEEGEVAVSGSCVMKGYEMRDHMDQDPNIETFTDGYMRSGDKGWVDAEGYLYLIGRFKELINRAGEKVSPFIVEDAVRKHEAVKDVLCFSCPHKLLGETVGVVCTVVEGKELKLNQLRDWLLARGIIAPMWAPEVLCIMPTIPKGPTGKPARINLAKKLELEELTGELKEFEHPGL